MKCLLFVTLLLAAATASALPHLETEFRIPLGSAPQSPSVSELNGNIYYTALANGNVTAADLKTKKILWSTSVSVNDGGINDFFFNGNSLVVPTDKALVVLDVATGGIIKKSESVAFESTGSQIKFTAKGDEVAILTPSQLVVVNSKTGVIVSTSDATGALSGETFCYVDFNDGKLKSKNVFTDTKMWTSPIVGSFAQVYYADKDYVVATVQTESYDTILYVASAFTGAQVTKVEAVNGISEFPDKVSISGPNVTFVAGEENYRLYVVEISTGYILSITPYTSSGGGGGSGENVVKRADGSYIRVRATQQGANDYGQGFQIVTSSSASGPWTVGKGCGETPSNAAPSLQYFADGAFKAGNLQGYVFWFIDTKGDCTVLDKNFESPNWTAPSSGAAPVKYDGLYVEVEGTAIVGFKFVA